MGGRAQYLLHVSNRFVSGGKRDTVYARNGTVLPVTVHGSKSMATRKPEPKPELEPKLKLNLRRGWKTPEWAEESEEMQGVERTEGQGAGLSGPFEQFPGLLQSLVSRCDYMAKGFDLVRVDYLLVDADGEEGDEGNHVDNHGQGHGFDLMLGELTPYPGRSHARVYRRNARPYACARAHVNAAPTCLHSMHSKRVHTPTRSCARMLTFPHKYCTTWLALGGGHFVWDPPSFDVEMGRAYLDAHQQKTQ